MTRSSITNITKYISRDYHVSKGFILPLTMLICTIVLLISSGITVILSKQLYFSKLSKLSQIAYYSADNGVACTVMIDDKYYDPDTGYGIFPHDPLVEPTTAIANTLEQVNLARQVRNLSTLTLTDLKCATSPIFDIDPDTSNTTFTAFSRLNSQGVTENGYTTSFTMRMAIGDGNYRCARVTVNKTANYRQIISRGFATCQQNLKQSVERAVVNTTEIQ